MIRVLLVIAAILIAAGPGAASAATRTVCFELAIKDQRYDCPSVGSANTAGVRRLCNSNRADDGYGNPMPGTGWVHPVGMEVEFWDKDTSPDPDDYIGTWRQQDNRTCVVFEWENASYSGGEANPDVYLKIKNRIMYAGSTTLLRIVKADGTVYNPVSSRNGWGGNPDAGTAVNCQIGVQCQIAPGQIIYVTGDAASDYGQALMALDSGQRILPVYYTQLDTGTIDINYPSSLYNPAIAQYRNLVDVYPGAADRGTLIVHELGHILQSDLFGVDPVDRDNLDYSGGADSFWYANLPEYDAVAVTEGWADYVAAVTWWDPSDTSSWPTVWGYWVEDAAPWGEACNDNRGIPIQSAKAFWDLDDASNEAAEMPAVLSDRVDMQTLDISAAWGSFPQGEADRESNEASVHGVNVHDYDFHYNVDDWTFKWHNCIQSQEL